MIAMVLVTCGPDRSTTNSLGEPFSGARWHCSPEATTPCDPSTVSFRFCPSHSRPWAAVTMAVGGTGGSTSDPLSGTAGSTSAGGTEDSGEGEGNGSGSVGESGSTGDPVQPPERTGDLAGDIQLGALIANQAVDIVLVQDGVPLEDGDRAAPVIAGRRMLLRADYDLEPGFVPRTLIGRLTMESPEWIEVFDDVRNVAAPGDPTTLGGTFQWIVPADSVRADATYAVALFEEEGSATQGSLGRAAVPEGGPAPLGAWGDPMVLDIMLVPFSCGGEQVEITPEDLADFEAYLFNTYPITALNLEVHDVVESSSCSEFDAAESDLPALREAEDAPPWVYYGGLLPGDGGGYSIAIEDSDQMGFRRTFANHTWRWYGLTFYLFAHELGHNHGRQHTFEDGEYPGDNAGLCGSRSGYGWGVTSGSMPRCGYSNDIELGLNWMDPNAQLLPPTARPCDGTPNANENSFSDFMSYAYPYWVSAYTYAAAADRVRLISSWRGAVDHTPPRDIVRFVIDGYGRVHEVRDRGVFEAGPDAAMALCEGTAVPMRVGTAIHDRHTSSGWVEERNSTYTFAPPPGVPASSCVVQTEAGALRPR